MIRQAPRLAAGLFVTSLLVAVPVAGAAREPASNSYSEELDVDRVLLPVTLVGRGCGQLEPDDVRILEDRAETPRVSAIERRTRARIHALVIDTSGSMGDGHAIEKAIAAAQRYVEGLPLGEQVMLVTFDDDVRLHVPLTTLRTENRRQAVVERLGRLTYGGGTAMRDAVYTTLRFLARFPQRKAMLLLTDGVDVSSPQRQGAFFEMAADLDDHDVAIFPIGLNIGRISASGKTLRKIATRTGGEFYALESGRAGDSQSLQETFETIREILLQQVTVEYVAAPWGKGARDPKRPGIDERIRRRVLIEIAAEAECRPAHYRRHRFVDPPRPSGTSETLSAWPPTPRPVPSEKKPVTLVDEWVEMYGGTISGTDTADLYVQTRDGKRVEGRSLEFMESFGPAYPGNSQWVSARNRSFTRMLPMPFGFTVPEFSRLTSGDYSFEHSLLDLLRSTDWMATAAGGRALRQALVVGPTVPSLREPIAETLFEHFPAYQRWIARKAELERRLGVERFVVDELLDLWRDVAPPAAASMDLEVMRADLLDQMRAGSSAPQAREWALDVARVVGAGSSADVGSVIDREWIISELQEGTSADLAGFAAEAVLATRLENALQSKPLPDRAARLLEQIRAARPLLVQRALSDADASDYARYAADWLEDLTPYVLATRLERAMANEWVHGALDVDSRQLRQTWESLGELLTGRGPRTHGLMLPVYDASRERIGFHRVGMPRTDFKVASTGTLRSPGKDSIHLREPFPDRPWGFLLARSLKRRDGGQPFEIDRIDHRVLDRRRVVEQVLAPLDELIEAMSDWGPESLRLYVQEGDQEDAYARMERLRKRRSMLQGRRDDLARQVRRLFRGPVVEIEIGFVTPGAEREHSRLLAYAPVTEWVDEDALVALHCVHFDEHVPVSSNAVPCRFVDELMQIRGTVAPLGG